MLNNLPTVRIYTAAPAQTVFNYPFRPFDLDYIVVIVDGVTFSRTAPGAGSGTWSSVSDPLVEGGSLTLGAACAGGEVVEVRRQLVRERVSNFPAVGPVPNSTLDRQFDYQLAILQEIADLGNELVSRALIVPLGEVGALLPAAALRSGKYLSFLSDGSPFMSLGTGADAGLRGDLASILGGDFIGLKAPYAQAVARTGAGKIFESVSAFDFGATGLGVVDDTTALQRAIDSNAPVLIIPPGTYLHANLNFNNAKQVIIAWGVTFIRIDPAATVTVSAREVKILGAYFSGGGLAGNNVTVTAPRAMFLFCDSNSTFGRALLADNDGGNMIVFCGVWSTLDATSNGYDIELRSTVVGGSLYTRLYGISTEQITGGILIDGQGTLKITDCQFGKYTCLRGGGSVMGNRIIGDMSVQGHSNLFSNNFFAGNIVFGDGVSANIGGHVFADTNSQASGKTFTINSNVIESSFHLEQLANVTLLILGPDNAIWHGRRAYVPTLQASGGSPVIGNGLLAGGYSRNGRDLTVDFEFVGGSSTNYGTGEFYITMPYKSGRYAVGAATVTEDGVRSYAAVISCANGAQRIAMMMADTGGDQNAGATYPFTWGDQDRFRGQITLSYTA